MKVKPTLEKISPDFGSSILVKKHTEFLKQIKAFWHFHPEIELVYVNKGKGKRHIGNHLSYFNNSQLLLLGSNLPHNGFTDRLTTNGSETLIQFKPDFLGDTERRAQGEVANRGLDMRRHGMRLHQLVQELIRVISLNYYLERYDFT